MDPERLEKIFRWRAHMDDLTRKIAQAEENGKPCAALRVTRSSLNLVMMKQYGICLDIEANKLITPDTETGVYVWTIHLQAVHDMENEGLLKELSED